MELGKALLNLGNREDATEAIRKAESLAGDDPSVQEAVAMLSGG